MGDGIRIWGKQFILFQFETVQVYLQEDIWIQTFRRIFFLSLVEVGMPFFIRLNQLGFDCWLCLPSLARLASKSSSLFIKRF